MSPHRTPGRRVTALLRGVASAGALVAVFTAIPVLLVQTVGNPWPGRQAFTLRDYNTILIGALATIGWIALALLILHTVGEFVRQLQDQRVHTLEVAAHRRVISARTSGPGLPPPAPAPRPTRGIVPRLVAAIIAALLLLRGGIGVAQAIPATSSSPTPAEATAQASGEADQPAAAFPESDTALAPITTAPAGSRPTWIVQPRDTRWGIAQAALGDSDRWREIWDLNHNRPQSDGTHLVDPSMIHVGWELLLPTSAAGPVAGSPATEPSKTPAPMQTGIDSGATYVVQAGDGPWNVAEALVGDGAEWPEVLAANVGHEVAPGVVYTSDTHHIHPGWTFTQLGPAGALPEPPANSTAPVAPAIETSITDVADPPTTDNEVTPEMAPPTVEEATTDPPQEGGLPSATTLPTTPIDAGEDVEPAIAVSAAAPDGTVETDDWLSSVGVRIGWTGSAALAAAILTAAAQLRRTRYRRRNIPGFEPEAETDLALRTTPLLDTTDWAAATLAELAHILRPAPDEPWPEPQIVRLDGTGIEVLWTAPRTELIDGWTSPDGGRTWHRSRTVDPQPVEIAPPFPALVTIGRHDGADVLLNLETIGVLRLTGDDGAVRAAARALSYESAASPFRDAALTFVGCGRLPGIGHLEWAHDASDLAPAAHWIRDRAITTAAMTRTRRLSSLAAIRALDTGDENHEPVIVIADAATVDRAQLADLEHHATPGSGAAVIEVEPSPDGDAYEVLSDAWTLECRDTGYVLHPLELRLEPIGLVETISDRIGLLLAEADSQAPGERPIAVHKPDPSADEQLAAAQLRLEEVLAADVVLRILGPVRVEGLPGDIKWATAELEILAYLALNRGGATPDTIRDTIWPNGSAAQTWRNTASRLRGKLGLTSDGDPRLSTQGPYGRYTLHPNVVTDWDQFTAIAELAELNNLDDRFELYRKAFQLLDGACFTDVPRGFSWAYSDGTVALIIRKVRSTAETALRTIPAPSDLRDDILRRCAAAGEDLADETCASVSVRWP